MTLPAQFPLLGVNMLYVAFVLFIIALYLQGKVGAKETGAMCILTGSINTIIALYNGLIMGDTASMGGGLLFAFTYLFFAFNIFSNADTYTGLGNYALGVTITTLPFIYVNFMAGAGILTFLWIMWGQLWFFFWVANGLKKEITKFLAINTYLVAIANFIIAIGFIFSWI